MTMLRSLFCVFFLLTTTLVCCQNPGPQPLDSFRQEINLETLLPSIAIPVFHKNGRGLNVEFTLRNNGANWYVPVGGNGTWHMDAGADSLAGWVLDAYALKGRFTNTGVSVVCNYPKHITEYKDWTYIDPSGTGHSNHSRAITTFAPNTCGYGTSESATADDGSGYYLSVVNTSQATAISPDGTTLSAGPLNTTYLTDRNGNRITYTYDGPSQVYTVTDTMGMPALKVYSDYWNTAHPIPSSSTYTWTSASNTSVTATLNFSPNVVRTNFQCSGILEFIGDPQYPQYFPSSLVLPDGSQYTFTYEGTPGFSGYTTGRLASVTLPTGGQITYDYSGQPNDDKSCSAPLTNSGPLLGLKRTTPDGTTTYTSALVNYTSGHNIQLKTTVLDPQNNQTVIYFSRENSPLTRQLRTHETERLVYSGTTTLLSTEITCYNGTPLPCTSASNTQDITEPVTQIASQTVYPNGQTSETDTYFDIYGFLPMTKNEYDFKAGVKGALLRTSLTTYGSYNSSTCTQLANLITSFPCTEIVQDGTGAQISQTRHSYDETGVVAHAAPTPQQIPIVGSRGNETTTSKWTSAATYLGNTSTFYDTGNTNVLTQSNGSTLTAGYPDATSTCGNSFVASVNRSLNLVSYSSYNCASGVFTSHTDENGRVSSVDLTVNGADPFSRSKGTVDGLGNETFYTYQSPLVAWSALTFNSNSSIVEQLNTLDSLGRLLNSQTLQAPGSSTFDTVSYTYDAAGRLFSTSMPCVAVQGATCPLTPGKAQTYDALGRPLVTTDGDGGTTTYTYTGNDVLVVQGPAPAGENAKQRQYEYDGLKRLASVCEITSAPGSGTCGQNNAKTGFWTRYKYDALGRLIGVCQNTTQPLATDCVQAPSSGQQTRTYSYDGLSRLTSETNPESQKVTYQYDTLPSGVCGAGTEAGVLTQKTMADGSYNCYLYDSLHRLTDVGYSATTGHCKRFRFDNSQGVLGSIPTGITVSNSMGRMAEAETDICTGWPSQASIITDEWFSYDADGRLTDVYEMTPNSGGYYHTMVAYWANGTVNTLSGIPGLSAWAFAPDGEGRLSSATYGTTKWVASTAYYPSNSQTTVSFGNGDKDVYGFDGKTGRMNSFTFTVGSTPQSLTGTPNWNANGTLGSLAITDPFNSVNTQTCSYTYDDLGRLAGKNSNGYSIDCGSGWQQLITLDAFGNITKSGTSSFAASYVNPSTGITNNQEQTVASCVPTYDANGNLTKDCSFLYTYSWDVYGNPVNLGGVGLTYDALDRKVEIATGSSHIQVLYSPIGSVGLMNGQIASKIRVPLPGGSTAVLVGVNGGTKQTLHSDWLGSSRLATTYGNRAVVYDTAYAPFGENYGVQGSSTYDLDFTGQFQDTLNGLDDFLYREYSPVQGRWISPDPAGLAAVDWHNPQGWNRYAYVGNNPLASTDPLGLCAMSGRLNPRCRDFVVDGFEGGSDSIAQGMLSAGAAFGCSNCDTNPHPDSNGKAWDFFKASGDGSAGFVPWSLPGASAGDIANALGLVKGAATHLGQLVDPTSLVGRGAAAYALLLKMGVAASDIMIYQNDGGDFAAVLSSQGFETLMGSHMQSHPGDVFLHFPYTNGARDFRPNDSLHAVWMDSRITDYVGGTGTYMQFHTDADNPSSGDRLGHLMCVFFGAGC
jgi:RHS repeat-associated protein